MIGETGVRLPASVRFFIYSVALIFTCNLFAVFLLFLAWLWMQVMPSLWQGEHLKKRQRVTHVSSASLELGPFRILLQDILFQLSILHKVMVSWCCCLVMHLRIDLVKILFPV